MERPIRNGLESVAKRYRLIRLAWLLSLIWAGLTITFCLLILSRNSTPNWLPASVPWLGEITPISLCWGAAILLALLFGFLVLNSYRDTPWVARQIEATYPDLKQRLITLLDQRHLDSPAFLRRQLEQETAQHATENFWVKTVPSNRLLVAWGVQLLALLMAFYAGSKASQALGLISNVDQAFDAQSIKDGGSIVIEPGDVEVERGEDVVVTVRLPSGNFLSENSNTLWIESASANENHGDLDNSSVAGASASSADNTAIAASAPLDKSPSLLTATGRVPLTRSLSDPMYGGVLRKVQHDLLYRIVSNGFESEVFRVQVFDYPALLRADAAIIPPSYLEEPERKVEDTRRLTVVTGSEINWTLRLNKSVQSVVMESADGQSAVFEQNAEDPRVWTGAMSPTTTQRWNLKVFDIDGRTLKNKEDFQIKVLDNEAPNIQLAQARDLSVSPLQEVLLQAKVRDDFGIKKAGVSLTIGDYGPVEIPLRAEKDSKGMIQLEHLVELEKLQAQPDQLLSYFFWAEDLDSNGEIRRSEGEMFFAEVRPFDEIFRQGDSAAAEQQSASSQQSGSQAAQQAEELAELQKKIISGTWNAIRELKLNTGRLISDSDRETLSEDLRTLSEAQLQSLQQTESLDSTVQDSSSRRYLEESRSAMRSAKEVLETASKDARTLEELTKRDLETALNQALVNARKAYEGLLKLRAREHSIVRSRQQSNSSQSRNASQQNRQQQMEQMELEEDNSNYQNEQQAVDEEITSAEREARQVMNRLDELAKRQKDLNEQLQQLETAIREAKSEEEKEQLEEQLKRLRENQEEMLRDTDELIDRMNQPENRQAMEETREQVEQAREQLQQSNQSLQEGETSSALNAGARAQRQMDETREQLRRESSSQLQESIQNLLEQAKRVEKQHNQLQTDLGKSGSVRSNAPVGSSDDENAEPATALAEDASPLRPQGVTHDSAQAQTAWHELRKNVENLLEDVKQSVEEAESSEPLMAEQLYDSYKQTKQSKVEQKIDQISQLTNRGLSDPAKGLAQDVETSLQELREKIEVASEQILGSEQEALRRALQNVEESRNEIREELNRHSAQNDALSHNEQSDGDASTNQTSRNTETLNSTSEQDDASQPNTKEQSDESAEGIAAQQNQSSRSSAPSDSQSLENGVAATEETESNSSSNDQSRSGSDIRQFLPNRGARPAGSTQQSENTSDNSQSSEDTEQRDRPSNDPGDNGPAEARGNRQETEGTRGGSELGRNRSNRPARSPLTGNDYQAWSDRLRDVEELVRNEDLKLEISRVREAAREMRVEYRRHSKEPEWDLVDKLIAEPLAQVQERINEELLRHAADKNSLVPIDRDPVPAQFQQRLEQYYENLGRSKSQP